MAIECKMVRAIFPIGRMEVIGVLTMFADNIVECYREA